jgi:hypothetical protein
MNTQWWYKSAGMAALATAMLIAPGARAAQTAAPGTLNYVQGQVSLEGRPLSTQQVGHVEVQPDQMLSTGQGKAEVLLSPGVFLRIGDNSQVRMISNDLVDPRVDVVHGEAMVEVDYLPKQAGLDVTERGADASLLKEGLYKFNAEEGQIAVVDGKARITDNGSSKEIGKGKEVVLNGGPLKDVKFDRKAEDSLYQWSNVRAQYLAEANQSTARNIYVMGGGGWWGPGWYWNPYFAMYSWVPGSGFFWSPFGYPFFSPAYVVYAPAVARFYGGAHTVAGAVHAGPARMPAIARSNGAAFRSGFAGNSHFAATPRMGFAGGFHGGMGRR